MSHNPSITFSQAHFLMLIMFPHLKCQILWTVVQKKNFVKKLIAWYLLISTQLIVNETNQQPQFLQVDFILLLRDQNLVPVSQLV